MTLLTNQPPGSPAPHRFKRDEYYKMLEMGFFEGHRVELIEGEIVEMAAMKDLHAVAIGVAQDALSRAFAGCWARAQLPLSFLQDSDPEPDFAVVVGSPRDYKGKGHPANALVVVEISDTSLRYDRGVKSALYAKAGIADYWIVNLNDMCVEVYRQPSEDKESPQGWKYRSVTTHRAGDMIKPLARPDAAISVSDLLP